MRIIKMKYMNEEQIRDEARKAANRSQFKSNHIYDHKSYEDGFYEGMRQALSQPPVVGQSEKLPKRLSNQAYKIAKTLRYEKFIEWWDSQV